MHWNFEITDFIAGCLIQYGNYLKIKKNALGWLCSMIAVVYWVLRAGSMDLKSQMFWHIVSFMVMSYGFLSWRRTETNIQGERKLNP
jgi:Nicotinamide mononucleotide transporter